MSLIQDKSDLIKSLLLADEAFEEIEFIQTLGEADYESTTKMLKRQTTNITLNISDSIATGYTTDDRLYDLQEVVQLWLYMRASSPTGTGAARYPEGILDRIEDIYTILGGANNRFAKLNGIQLSPYVVEHIEDGWLATIIIS